ncbi:MAG: alpha/beta hydrolase family protein [Acidimicrobiales bacterium]
MTSAAVWFGLPGRPMFARWHLPEDGTARAGIVLCPPFGLEAQAAGRAYRALAAMLASEGFAVLHIDYDGTGDSAGSEDDPERVEAWQGSVRAAVELLRSSGAPRICVVGMRLGATVAASVAESCGLDALVLWDPCDSGRSYLREQILLRAVYLRDQGLDSSTDESGPTGGAAVETLGAVYGDDTVRAMGRLSIESSPGSLAQHVLALFRPERRPRRAVQERLSSAGADLAEAVGQEELLSVWPLKAPVPSDTLDTIVTWLSGAVGTQKSPVVLSGAQTAVIRSPDGEEIVEEIACLGRNRLFGILTRPTARPPGPTVVMLNSGKLDHLGPGRLWVHLARAWARTGLAVLRVDLSGLGDSPVQQGREPDVVYSPDALLDIADIAGFVSPGDPAAVVLMGLCSGADHSIEAALSMGARAVFAINPIFAAKPAEAPGGAQPVRASNLARLPQAADVLSRASARRLARYAPPGLIRQFSNLRWWLVHRAGGGTVPAFVLKRLSHKGVDTLVVCSKDEGWWVQRGEAATLRRLQQRGGFRLEVFPAVDHTLYTQASLNQVLPLLNEQMSAIRAKSGPVSG